LSITKIFIDKSICDADETASVVSKLNIAPEIVESADIVYEYILSSDDPVQKGKETLFITTNKGNFIKSCPGTKHYNCCGYMIINIGTFCNMDCSYCILQTYFHPPVMKYFINHNELFSEIESYFKIRKIMRFGTGEFTDSLIWDNWTILSEKLISKFAGQSSCVLELKTKTTKIDALKKHDHRRKTIIAWSINTEKIIQSEERETASLSERLAAAKKCENWGYPLAFHFDPIVIYDGCEDDYKNVITRLFSIISIENIVWISLGTFRFMPELKPIIQKRFPDSKIIYGEFISGLDNKMRYFKPLRTSFYKKIISWIRQIAPYVTIYFCMEDDIVWRNSFGFIPKEQGGLKKILDESAFKHCGLIES